MDIVQAGVILNTENYTQCVALYSRVFSLPILFTQHEGDFRATCFSWCGAYLMIETGGKSAVKGQKPIEQGAAKLRFNVLDIDRALTHLVSLGIDAKIEQNDWGRTINLCDPDGNRIGIRDDLSFKNQYET